MMYVCMFSTNEIQLKTPDSARLTRSHLLWLFPWGRSTAARQSFSSHHTDIEQAQELEDPPKAETSPGLSTKRIGWSKDFKRDIFWKCGSQSLEEWRCQEPKLLELQCDGSRPWWLELCLTRSEVRAASTKKHLRLPSVDQKKEWAELNLGFDYCRK